MPPPGRFARLAGAAIAGYLLGTIPSADLAAQAATAGRADLRTSGSGNPGAANALAVLGTGWGLGVMAADVGKGAAACGLGRRIAGDDGAHLAGTTAVIGHCYPVWNGFRGGKGVAASAGQCLANFPAYFAFDLGVAALSVSSPKWKQRAFVATAAASACWVTAGAVWVRNGWPNAWGPRPTMALPLSAAASSAVILDKFRRAAAVERPA
ncbi:MAG TPA: glycerol-3-phosphate acyltransferase [Acidimicrobiales bacterium]|nr:glycerol-3-phosphate acyltransferase [Acidimicrobiales bacterium]